MYVPLVPFLEWFRMARRSRLLGSSRMYGLSMSVVLTGPLVTFARWFHVVPPSVDFATFIWL